MFFGCLGLEETEENFEIKIIIYFADILSCSTSRPPSSLGGVPNRAWVGSKILPRTRKFEVSVISSFCPLAVVALESD